MIAEVEGPNELNNKFPPQELNMKYKGRIDEAAGAAYMDDYYRAIKTDPATRDLPVVAFTAIFTDYRLAKPHNSFDYSNMHSYQGYDVPSGSLEMNFTRFNNILPAGALIKPFVPTECGYNVEEDLTNHNLSTGCRAAQAKKHPHAFRRVFPPRHSADLPLRPAQRRRLRAAGKRREDETAGILRREEPDRRAPRRRLEPPIEAVGRG